MPLAQLVQPSLPFFGVIDAPNRKGRTPGATNAAIWFNLCYYVRHGKFMDGTPKRMIAELKKHPKMGLARQAVSKERKGIYVDHQQYFKNTNARNSGKLTRRGDPGKRNGGRREDRAGGVVDINERRQARFGEG